MTARKVRRIDPAMVAPTTDPPPPRIRVKAGKHRSQPMARTAPSGMGDARRWEAYRAQNQAAKVATDDEDGMTPAQQRRYRKKLKGGRAQTRRMLSAALNQQ